MAFSASPARPAWVSHAAIASDSVLFIARGPAVPSMPTACSRPDADRVQPHGRVAALAVGAVRQRNGPARRAVRETLLQLHDRVSPAQHAVAAGDRVGLRL